MLLKFLNTDNIKSSHILILSSGASFCSGSPLFHPPDDNQLLQSFDLVHNQSLTPGPKLRGGSFLQAAVRFSSWFVSVMSPGGLTCRWLFPPGWAVLSRSVPSQLADDSRVSQRAESVTSLAERSWLWLKEHLHNITAERPDSPQSPHPTSAALCRKYQNVFK